MKLLLAALVVLWGVPTLRQESVEPCYAVHGRLSYYNGTPSTRMWIVGTHRMLGLPSEDSQLPANVKALLKGFGDNIFGDYVVCPLQKYRKGEMQMVYVKSATHLLNRRVDPSD